MLVSLKRLDTFFAKSDVDAEERLTGDLVERPSQRNLDFTKAKKWLAGGKKIVKRRSAVSVQTAVANKRVHGQTSAVFKSGGKAPRNTKPLMRQGAL
jgi:hypothetical protein